MRATSSRLSLLVATALVAALSAPASSSADDAVTDLVRDTTISAYAGALAWSSYDEKSSAYALVIRQDGMTAPARVAAASQPFDVSLGPDGKGRTVALYTRCAAKNRRCDIYRYDLRARTERKLASVSSPSLDEAWPAQWRGRIAFVRRARTHVVDGYDHRPDPRGRGPVMDCDIPYVKTLASRAPSRRLDRSQCGETTGVAIRRDTIVVVTDINQGGAGSESQVRSLRARGGAARILARATGGEGGYSPFVTPSLSASAVWLARTGRRQGVTRGFLRIGLASARRQTVAGDVRSLARDERGRIWYVEGPELDWDGYSSCRSTIEPCRLVRASASPFSSASRTLLARVSVDGAAFADFREAFAGEPLVLSGRVSRAIVRKGAVVGAEAVPGVVMVLLRNRSVEYAGPFTSTDLTATTDDAGRWAFSLSPPPPAITVAAFAPAISFTSVLVGITSSARLTLGATGLTLAGAVAPAQPGRVVEVQRLIADARGRLPDGRRVCGGPPTSLSCTDEAWTTVTPAPLDAAGTAFSAQVAGPGVYRARLPSDPDRAGQATAYGGASPEVRVTG